MGFFVTKGKSVWLLYLFGLECLRIDRSEYKIRIFSWKIMPAEPSGYTYVVAFM